LPLQYHPFQWIPQSYVSLQLPVFRPVNQLLVSQSSVNLCFESNRDRCEQTEAAFAPHNLDKSSQPSSSQLKKIEALHIWNERLAEEEKGSIHNEGTKASSPDISKGSVSFESQKKRLMAVIDYSISQVEPNPKQRRPRNDIFKAKIVKTCLKLPTSLIHFDSKRGVVVLEKDVKSKNLYEFKQAFEVVFKFFWTVMVEENLVAADPTPRNFLDFMCLAFSEKRVLEVARGMNMESIAKEQCA